MREGVGVDGIVDEERVAAGGGNSEENRREMSIQGPMSVDRVVKFRTFLLGGI